MSSRKNPPPSAISHAYEHRLIKDELADGRMPTLEELLSGHAWGRGRLADIITWSRALLAEPEMTDPDLRDALHLVSVACSPGLLVSAITELTRVEAETSATDADLGRQLADGIWRCRLYLASMGKGGRQELARHLIFGAQDSYRDSERIAFALGLLTSRYAVGFDQPGHVMSLGKTTLNRLSGMVNDVDRANDVLDAPAEDELHGHPDDDDLSDAMMAVAEDRAEVLAPRVRPIHVAMVVPALTAELTGFRRDIWKTFEGVAGKALPLVRRGDPFAHQLALQARFPHAAEAISTVLRDLASDEVAHLRPTLFIGSPGCGKTSLARAIADVIGLPSTIYSAGGSSDSSAMGTSAQWHSARPSVALDLIRRCGKANPAVILDEIDKIDLDRRNGSLADALLGFLERGTAARYRDLALEVEVDLSHVNWIATANNVKDVPAPLRDRLRIVPIQDPTWSHLGDLSRRILDEIADERGLDERWIEDLAQDEIEVIKAAWPGGSLRKLRRALEVLVDGREQLMGRA